jgi:hypothetical protein
MQQQEVAVVAGGRGGYPDQRPYEQQPRYEQQQRYEQRRYDQSGYQPRGNIGGNGGRGNQGPQQQYGDGPRLVCQVCGKEGHTALACWKRFQKNHRGPEKSAGVAVGHYGVDTNWYYDTGATDHITGELDKVHVKDRYNGNDQIHTASGAGMDICHVGSSVFHTPSHDLHLNNILHVPKATKSLLSTSLLTRDNHAFVEYWPNSFFVKDQDTSIVNHISSWSSSSWCRQVFFIALA